MTEIKTMIKILIDHELMLNSWTIEIKILTMMITEETKVLDTRKKIQEIILQKISNQVRIVLNKIASMEPVALEQIVTSIILLIERDAS